ncbi:MAG: hypothetical protein H7274_13695 [Rhodoferax sp.]|nr:hypothetical protein [Rhodoferax sp.]
MSVINKMLRDLDHRQGANATDTPDGVTPAASALRHGTTSVAMDHRVGSRAPIHSARLWWGMACLAGVAAALGGWFWWSTTPSVMPLEAATAPAMARPLQTVSPPASVPVAASVLVATAAPSPDAGGETVDAPSAPPANLRVTAMTLRMEPSLSARRALDALLSTPAPVAVRTPAAPPPQTSVSSPATAASVAAPQPALAAAPPLTSAADRPKARAPAANAAAPTTLATDNSAPAIQRQQQAGGDAMAQAQNLWNSGSHDAAIDLMQQSIAAAERSVKAGTAAGGATVVLVPLVREMARMQLAEARFGAVWEMLTRLEPLLGNQADLWAIRANAAQRLGRHPDSVHAYMMALQSRPDEQRWLLGTAVSLAALGQTTSAAEMAEKARAVGPVSKDILAYLRQTGVPLREP